MRQAASFRRAFTLAALLSLSCLGVQVDLSSAETAVEAVDLSSAETEVETAAGTLAANVYLQTSAEYRACCRGIYTAAGFRLEELLGNAEQPPMCPAVVMDLDETVLDNSSFQTYLYEKGLEYTPELWGRFERSGIEEVGLVPGVKPFIEKAESLGVTIVYLSNRNERNEESTIAAMAGVGLDTTRIRQRIFLKPEGGSSDKSPRRDAVSTRYNVLMYFGDNLRDFSDVFEVEELSESAATEDYLDAIHARAQAVEDAACHWGVDWFVLPNPIYGEWEALIPSDPVSILRPPAAELAR